MQRTPCHGFVDSEFGHLGSHHASRRRRAGSIPSPLLVLLAAWFLFCPALRATELYVSTDGADTNPGTKERPLASIERARDLVRALRRPLASPVTVFIRGGIYRHTREIEFFARDSGSDSTPISYQAYEGESPRFVGGPFLNASPNEWRPVSDRQVLNRLPSTARRAVRQIDLRALGITNFGTLKSRGWGRPPEAAAAEVFLNGDRMPLARWPNLGDWSKIAGFPAASARPDNHGGNIGEIAGGFLYSGDRPKRWKDPTNVWVHGFWAWNWANSRERIASIDPEQRLIKTAPPGGHFGFRPNQRITFYNTLEELDQPGEWFLDRTSGLLYFWPPNNSKDTELLLTVLDRPFLTFRETSFVNVRGLSFEGTRSFGIWIQNGRSNQISSCLVRDIGNYGIYIVDGSGHSVVGCEVYETGDGAVGLKGGNRLNLTPSGHRIEYCHLHHNGQWAYTYVPSIKLDGVGIRVAHNLIHDHPHTAILFEGNDHIIEYNEIHHVALDTGDTGAIYTGRDWSFRGNKIRYNYLHDVIGHENYGKGIYMDDCSSGAEIVGNIFQNMKRAIQLGGGRDHRVENNQFIDCDTGIDVDGRGVDNSPIWQAGQKIMRDQWNALPADTRRLYVQRYPELRSLIPYLDAAKPVPPENNVIARNLAQGSGKFLDIRWNAERTPPSQQDNTVATGPLKNSPKSRRELRATSQTLGPKAGFKPIPIDDIGLMDHPSRNALPRVPGAMRL